MKKAITSFTIALLGMFIFSQNAVFAQCVDMPDQSLNSGAIPPTATTFISGQYLAQTFTPAATNSVGASIVVPPAYGPGTFTIQLWTGTPDAPGAMLASGSAPIAAGGGTATASWFQVPLTPGGPHFLLISSADVTLGFFTTSDPGTDQYAGGAAYFFPTFALPFDIYFTTITCEPVVPTLSQWGFILLTLIFLTFGTVILLQEKLVPAMAADTGSYSINIKGQHLPFDISSFKNGLLFALGIAVAIFGAAILFFGYSWMKADLIGLTFTMPLLAYLIHLFLIVKE